MYKKIEDVFIKQDGPDGQPEYYCAYITGTGQSVKARITKQTYDSIREKQKNDNPENRE